MYILYLSHLPGADLGNWNGVQLFAATPISRDHAPLDGRPRNTVQDEILAREIFGEIARLKHLANFTLTNDIWMY